MALDSALECLEREATVDILTLNAAMNRLAAVDARQARIVELRVFGGLTVKETAEVLDLSPATVKREWSVARLWDDPGCPNSCLAEGAGIPAVEFLRFPRSRLHYFISGVTTPA